ncbi:hypothetical protein CN349_03620, partial [Bacillus cereus]
IIVYILYIKEINELSAIFGQLKKVSYLGNLFNFCFYYSICLIFEYLMVKTYKLTLLSKSKYDAIIVRFFRGKKNDKFK